MQCALSVLQNKFKIREISGLRPQMNLTRRSFVLLSLCTSAQRLLGQNEGIATRDVKAQPKPAPSGRPFNAHFTDVAKEAGLRMPTIYGGVDSKKYIMEA